MLKTRITQWQSILEKHAQQGATKRPILARIQRKSDATGPEQTCCHASSILERNPCSGLQFSLRFLYSVQLLFKQPVSNRNDKVAVSRPSPPCHADRSHHFVISTEAQRSGEISNLPALSSRPKPPLCHLDRSAAEWRDLKPRLRNLQQNLAIRGLRFLYSNQLLFKQPVSSLAVRIEMTE